MIKKAITMQQLRAITEELKRSGKFFRRPLQQDLETRTWRIGSEKDIGMPGTHTTAVSVYNPYRVGKLRRPGTRANGVYIPGKRDTDRPVFTNKLSPKAQEVLRRITIAHEFFEQKKQQNLARNRLLNLIQEKRRSMLPNTPDNASMIGFSAHAAPSILAQEHNMLRALPKLQVGEQKAIRDVYRKLRAGPDGYGYVSGGRELVNFAENFGYNLNYGSGKRVSNRQMNLADKRVIDTHKNYFNLDMLRAHPQRPDLQLP
jgi:hypothetical protein